MYKLLLFLHKTDDEQVIDHFEKYTVKYISEITGQDIKIGTVESNLLLEQKFGKFCEVTIESKEQWQKLLNSKAGRDLNNDLMDFHKSVTVIFVDYPNNLERI